MRFAGAKQTTLKAPPNLPSPFGPSQTKQSHYSSKMNHSSINSSSHRPPHLNPSNSTPVNFVMLPIANYPNRLVCISPQLVTRQLNTTLISQHSGVFRLCVVIPNSKAKREKAIRTNKSDFNNHLRTPRQRKRRTKPNRTGPIEKQKRQT